MPQDIRSVVHVVNNVVAVCLRKGKDKEEENFLMVDALTGDQLFGLNLHRQTISHIESVPYLRDEFAFFTGGLDDKLKLLVVDHDLNVLKLKEFDVPISKQVIYRAMRVVGNILVYADASASLKAIEFFRVDDQFLDF